MRPVVALVVALWVTVSIPQVAVAGTSTLQPGVHVDPGSPAGKEYQIPVVGARSETAGGTQGQGGNPPLFGVGVTPATTASADSSAGRPTSSSSASRGATSHSTRTRTAASSSPSGSKPVSAVAPPDPDGSAPAGGNGWIALVAGGLLVLVLGGGGGLLLRGRVLRS